MFLLLVSSDRKILFESYFRWVTTTRCVDWTLPQNFKVDWLELEAILDIKRILSSIIYREFLDMSFVKIYTLRIYAQEVSKLHATPRSETTTAFWWLIMMFSQEQAKHGFSILIYEN